MSACKPFAANQNKENDVSEDRPLSVCTAPFEELNTENTPQKAEKQADAQVEMKQTLGQIEEMISKINGFKGESVENLPDKDQFDSMLKQLQTQFSSVIR